MIFLTYAGTKEKRKRRWDKSHVPLCQYDNNSSSLYFTTDFPFSLPAWLCSSMFMYLILQYEMKYFTLLLFILGFTLTHKVQSYKLCSTTTMTGCQKQVLLFACTASCSQITTEYVSHDTTSKATSAVLLRVSRMCSQLPAAAATLPKFNICWDCVTEVLSQWCGHCCSVTRGCWRRFITVSRANCIFQMH